MTTLSLLDAIERPAILGFREDEGNMGRESQPGAHHGHDQEPRPAAGPGSGPTLDDLLTGTWDALTAGQTATCPVCSGPMEPRYSAGPVPVGGRCSRCATELS